MPKHDYLFVDESGDPAYTVDETGQLLSSSYYVAAVLHLCDDAFRAINEHIAAFRYYSKLNRELKIPAGTQDYTKLMEPIKVHAEGGANIWASVVYVDKERYAGSYLKPDQDRPPSAKLFRNYILRRLLEHHFRNYDLKSRQYDLVLDRVDMARSDQEELRRYIARNHNIPTPVYITHASSIYVEGLQVVHHIANGYRDVVSAGQAPAELSFVSPRDLTIDHYGQS